MRSDRRTLLLGAVLGVMFVPGCARSLMDRSIVDTHGSIEAELEFWGELEGEALVTSHDALHGLWLLAEGEDDRDGYERRCADAVQAGWWPRTLPPANEAVEVGMVARALWDILDLPASLLTVLVGPTPRESLQALQRLGLLPPRSRRQGISGAEFVDLIARAAEQLDEAADAEEDS